MRTHHCLTLFLCGAFLLGSSQADAQGPPGAGYSAFGNNTPINPAGVPAGYNPYPAISPFEQSLSSTYNDRGIWLNETSTRFRKTGYFSLDAIVGLVKDPSATTIGFGNDRTPQMFFDGGDEVLDNGTGGRTSDGYALDQSAFEPTSYYYDHDPFPARNTNSMNGSRPYGIRGILGIERPDGVGIEFEGFGLFPETEQTTVGTPIKRIGPSDVLPTTVFYNFDGIVETPRAPGLIPGPGGLAYDLIDMDSAGAMNPGIRFDDGSILGTTLRTDLYMATDWRSELYGASFSLLQAATRKVGPFTVRPVGGVRYLNSKELFSIEGHDSGADYDVELEDTTDSDSVLIGGAQDTGTAVRLPYRIYLDSETETHLGGAEMGWRYTAGGDQFKLQGETRVGIMGARESSNLYTKGFGQPLIVNAPTRVLLPSDTVLTADGNDLYDPELETNAEQESHFVTPTFQQSFNTTSKPFAYVPVIKEIPLFREANFKAGWTFLLIGQLQRPNEQIIYQSGNGAIPEALVDDYGAPAGDTTLEPGIKKDRSLYFVNYFNFGLEWVY